MDGFTTRFIDNEADEFAAEQGVEAGADTGAEAVGAETAETPSAPTWTPPQEQWEQIVESQQRQAQFMDWLMQEAQQGAQQQQPPELPDPYEDPVAYAEAREQRLLYEMDQRFARYEPVLQQTAQQQAEAERAQLLDQAGLAAGPDDESPQTLARNAASWMASAAEQAGHPAQEAVRFAAEHVRQMVQKERAAAVEEYKRSLGEPPAADGGPAVYGSASRIEPAARDYDEIIQRVNARHNV
jgi:hypothetical protein